MTTLLSPTASNAALARQIHDAIANACERIPPMWPLQSFVAVNPFIGLTDRTFADACALMQRVTHGGMLMPAAYYREQGAALVTDADLQNALDQTQSTLSINDLRAWLEHDVPVANAAMPTVAESFDAWSHGHWTAFIVDEVSKWCSAYYDAGQASWRMPWRGLDLFNAWKSAAVDDANPEMMGLSGFRDFVRELPDNAPAVIALALDELGVAPDERADFLHRQLMSVGGWSAYTRYLAREREMRGETDDSLPQLLAIRLAHDLALYRHAGADFVAVWAQQLERARAFASDEISPAYLWQLAAENACQRALIGRIRADRASKSAAEPTRTAAQAAFCIDVRSEVFRRHLEAAMPAIQTIGFAGFFGFAIEFVPFGAQHGDAQCPALLLPKYRIEAAAPGATPAQNAELLAEKRFSQLVGRAWNSFKTSAISCFAFVETGGWLAGGKLIKDTCCVPHDDGDVPDAPRVFGDGKSADAIDLADRIATAAGALTGMGLTHNLAPLVLICGHGSHTTNNPYAAGLDCGACGGHSGAANARVAVAVFNDPLVRAALREQNIDIPDDTWFIAGVHTTTTDEVTLFDVEKAPASHAEKLNELGAALKLAGQGTRAERAGSLHLKAASPAELDEKIRARSNDWSQTRPEWGLAGNASFIVAPRARTSQLDLGGRAFLQDYDYHRDPQGAVLEALMTAPVVVGCWINMQYFASTVNNAQWGSGNKTIHNVVGTFGIWEGNAGDLKVGLPLQSVYDGTRYVHEPVRLSVLVEAPRAMIERVIETQSSVRDLVDNGWLLLVAIEDEGRKFWRYNGNLQWEEV